jgi:uncharacterized membrane protein
VNAAAERQDPGPDLTAAAAMLTAAGLVWLLLVVASPMAARRGQGGWLAAAVYQAGSLICHQRPERSFHLDGVQLPVCARCFGLYASGALGLVLAWMRRGRFPAARVRAALALAAVPVAATVGLEWIGAIETTNVFRMLTAVPLGVVGGVVMIRLLRGDSAASGGRRFAADTL